MIDDFVPPRPPSRQPRPSHAELAYKGKLFDVWQWQQQLFDGKIATFESLSRPDTALVLPVLPDGTVLFIDETQPGTPSMLRTIGGRIEPGESPKEAVARELREEVGLEASDFRLWAAWQPINKVDWAVYLYIAHGTRDLGVTQHEAGERIFKKPMSLHDLLDGDTAPNLDDYEFLHALNFARGDANERERVRCLLTR